MSETIYYQMYQEELEKIVPCSAQEQEKLVRLLMQGDEGAINRLVEGNLVKVMSIAEEYANKGVLIEDLVAEGNLALTLAVGSYEDGDFNAFIEEAIHRAMEALVAQEDNYDETGTNLAALLNVLDEVSTRLAAEYGREATVREIAHKMKMDEDQIKELMKMALDAVAASVPQETQEEMYLDQDMVSESDEDDGKDMDLDIDLDLDMPE